MTAQPRPAGYVAHAPPQRPGVGARRMKCSAIIALLAWLTCAGCFSEPLARAPSQAEPMQFPPGERILVYRGKADALAPSTLGWPLTVKWAVPPEEKVRYDDAVRLLERHQFCGVEFHCKGEMEKGEFRIDSIRLKEGQFQEGQFILEYRITNSLYKSSPPAFVIRRTFTTYSSVKTVYWEVPAEQKTTIDNILKAADENMTDKVRFTSRCRFFRDWRFSPLWVTDIHQTNIEFNVRDEITAPQPKPERDGLKPAR